MHSTTPSGRIKGPTTGCSRSQRTFAQIRIQNLDALPQHEREDSNPMRQFWRLTALPGARS